MTTLRNAIYGRRDPPAATPIRVAVAVSLLIHAAAMWEWLPLVRLPTFELPEWSDADGRLTVRLAPLPGPPPTPQRSPALQSRPQPAPPVIALSRPAPPPTAPSLTAPAPASPPADGDLSSYIEARRRVRADSAPAASQGRVSDAPASESDNARASRIAAANLAAPHQLTFGYDPSRSGGVFQMERVAQDHAEFTFVGWNSDARRHTKQLIEVRKGNNSNIRIAVVRRMIAIIRQYEPEEFLWESQRLGRSLTLSSRARDNAGLEDFMLQEFFEGRR